MNLYHAAADLIGTSEGRALAARLTSWHDAMVNHARAVRLRGEPCHDECAHEHARVLWAMALDVFGDHALRFAFLQMHGIAVEESDTAGRTIGHGRAASH